jgi:hypothetical protein
MVSGYQNLQVEALVNEVAGTGVVDARPRGMVDFPKGDSRPGGTVEEQFRPGVIRSASRARPGQAEPPTPPLFSSRFVGQGRRQGRSLATNALAELFEEHRSYPGNLLEMRAPSQESCAGARAGRRNPDVVYRDGTPSPPKILNDLAEYLRDLPVNRQRFDDRQGQEFIELFEISLKPRSFCETGT